MTDDEFDSMETVKANVMLTLPVSGTVYRGSPAMETTPEITNKDPFGKG